MHSSWKEKFGGSNGQNRTPLVTPCTRVPVLLTFPCSFSVQVVSVSADFEIKFETPSSWIILGKSSQS